MICCVVWPPLFDRMSVEYTCPRCGHFNSKRRRFPGAAATPSRPAAVVTQSPQDPDTTTSPSPNQDDDSIRRRLQFAEESTLLNSQEGTEKTKNDGAQVHLTQAKGRRGNPKSNGEEDSLR